MAEYVRDTFSRTVASGWGTGETGGAWTEALVNVTSSVVTNTQARATFPANTSAGTLDERLASATAARDVMSACSFDVKTTWLAGTWTGISVWQWVRVSGTVAAPTGYYARCSVAAPDGSMRLSVGYAVAGATTELGFVAFPAGTAFAAASFRFELQAVGSGATKVQARIWRIGTTPPPGNVGWLLVADDVGPQVAGVYAARIDRGAPPSAVSQVADIFDWYVTDPPVPDFAYTATGLTATFATTGTTGDFTSYAWDWGDGTAAGSGTAPSHAYGGPGTYLVKLTGTTRWSATFTHQGGVTVAAPLPAPPELLPVVLVDGVDVCDDLYSVTWGMGGDYWTQGFRGQTASLRLRGQYVVDRGAPVTIAVPAAVSGVPLWQGIVDEASETIEPVTARNETMITAMDAASWAARRHLRKSAILPEVRLPARLVDLRTGDLDFRYGYGGYPVDGTRWPLLHKRPLAAAGENLRDRTYLDMVTEALNGSIAYGFVARDGVIVYAPWEAPAGLPSTLFINVDTGVDCASRVTLDRNSLEGIVNRWSEGPEAYDFENVPSIEEYGERAWSIPDDVLTIDGSLPHTTAMRAAMAEPVRAATVEIPVTDWAQKAVTVEPLKLALCRGTVMTVLGVRHEISVGDAWRCTLTLDRNPWSVDGRPVP